MDEGVKKENKLYDFVIRAFYGFFSFVCISTDILWALTHPKPRSA